MGSGERWVVPLEGLAADDEARVGGKAAKLGQLTRAGFRVPVGFAIPTRAYEQFVKANGLTAIIQMELGRKPLAAMRWEEIWDAALRIRSAFLSAPVPEAIGTAIGDALAALGDRAAVAVRSSAPGEDSAARSFAGLHESVVGVVGPLDVVNAVQVVWASLWSDAALLYRRELELDPTRSRMAVLVQAMAFADRSGVAFGRDPRDLDRDVAVVEAVPGLCRDLVDGAVDPDRWMLDRSSGAVLEWRAGSRDGSQSTEPVLETEDLGALHQSLVAVEDLFGWPPDMEWTGNARDLTLLQARPITTTSPEPDERAWYLTLRPGSDQLRRLCDRVAGVLIPQLEAEGERLAREELESLGDEALAGSIEARHAAVQHWKKVYWDDFIPFAHGARQLATYYNDAVRPDDPYEFVGLLRGQPLLAAQRNQRLEELAQRIRRSERLGGLLSQMAGSSPGSASWEALWQQLRQDPEGSAFAAELESVLEQFLDVSYDDQRLKERPDLLINVLVQRAGAGEAAAATGAAGDSTGGGDAEPQALEERLLAAVGDARREEALEILAIARLSWRLRDDDNLLVGRVESQLLRAIGLGLERLRAVGRVSGEVEGTAARANAVAAALRNPGGGPIELPAEARPEPQMRGLAPGEKSRQLVGQPGSPGLATGSVRCVRGPDDLGRFQAGEVLVCDAIQPHMTHLVPLACAVVERRGGMLIHGAIIARELGLPCVNGIADAVELLEDGEMVTVDGNTGIVTVGAPDFSLEGVE